MGKYSISLFLILIYFCSVSCKNETEQTSVKESTEETSLVTYATGFTLTEFPDYTLLEVSGAFPETENTYRYALVKEEISITKSSKNENTKSLASLLKAQEIDAIIKVPIQSVVVTSTTHLPSLELLEVDQTLIGFPNLDYISSESIRKRITEGQIKELGQNESMNTEVAIDLNPDVVIGFGVDGQNKSLNAIERAGIPVLYNGDWVEKDPLGKAEWIKFFGALYDKSEKANDVFKTIEHGYLETKKLAQNVTHKPTVLSGAMYKDIWYLPNGESWPAKLIKDAGGNYLWADTKGTGSIALNIESVLEKGQDAAFWIAPGQFGSYSKLQEANAAYTHFDAFTNKKVYTFTSKKGATGGLLYYELAPNRPDIVLKDIVYYLHPELIPDYTPYFYTPLED